MIKKGTAIRENELIGDAQLHAREVLHAGNRLDGEEVTEALLAVEDAADGQAQLLRLIEELGSQLGVGEVPEMIAVDEGEGDGQQLRLLRAVAVQRKGGNAGHVDGRGAAENGIEHIVLGAQHAGGLNVDGDRAAGERFNLLLEVRGGLSDDGIQRIDLGVDERHLGVGLCDCGGHAQQQGQREERAKDLFHVFFLLFDFGSDA